MQEVSLKIAIIKADITQMKVDAIVNAANPTLSDGSGVNGAIHRAGGPAIMDECRKIISRQGSCKTGEAVITTGGNLQAKFVIHTVGPVWKGGQHDEDEKLTNCYRNALKLAVDNHCKTLAFPNISTGIYGFPVDRAAAISVKTVFDYLKGSEKIDKVFMVCFDDESLDLLTRELASLTSKPESH